MKPNQNRRSHRLAAWLATQNPEWITEQAEGRFNRYLDQAAAFLWIALAVWSVALLVVWL